jgi:hypothetical protein
LGCDNKIARRHNPCAARNCCAVHDSNRDKTGLANCYQSVRDHLGRRMRLRLVGRFLQIQPRAKCRACSAQNDHAFLRLVGSNLNGGV